MTASKPLKNILLVGAGGSLGSVLLNGLLSNSTFTVTVLARSSSRSLSSIPSHIKVIKIDDSYPYADLVSAFQGQDAIVNALTSTEVTEQFRFIDAAVEAGVKRYVPSEYGLNNLDPRAVALNTVFSGKGKVQLYLREKAETTSLTWTSIACGMWIDWSMKNSFLGLDVKNKKMTYTDDGNGLFSTTTMENTALALNGVLLKPEETANKLLLVSDFAVSQRQLVDAIERVSGEKWTTETLHSAPAIMEGQKSYAEGNHAAVYKLIELGFTTGKFSGHLEAEGPLSNDLLGLKKRELDEVVAAGLAQFK